MYLGIEIGGTKLQLGVARKPGANLECLVRHNVDQAAGSQGILDAIIDAFASISDQQSIERIGIGFGGPVDAVNGRTRRSYHVEGWDDFPLVEWCQDNLGLPAVMDNDCNASALAEATAREERGSSRVFYVTVGTGIGAGLVMYDEIFGADRPAITELGHLRPFPVDEPDSIVEDYASGPGIAAMYHAKLDLDDLSDDTALPQAKDIALAAHSGDPVAADIFDRAVRILGWAIAQAVTITSPEIVVVGGGVSLAHPDVFLTPLTDYVSMYVMDSLRDTYTIEPAVYGEEVVLQGAIALAALGERDY